VAGTAGSAEATNTPFLSQKIPLPGSLAKLKVLPILFIEFLSSVNNIHSLSRRAFGPEFCQPRCTAVIARSDSDEAIQNGIFDWIASRALAMTSARNALPSWLDLIQPSTTFRSHEDVDTRAKRAGTSARIPLTRLGSHIRSSLATLSRKGRE